MSHLYFTYGAENAAGSPPPTVHPPHAPHRRSPQAWSADPRRAPAPLPLSQFTDLSASPPQPLPAAATMSSARPVPPSSRPSPYDDNLFHVMGKPFADPSQPLPASSPPPRPAPQQPPFTQPHTASTVFDPSDFPSLGAVGAHAAMQPATSSLLDNNPSIDHNITNASLSAPTLNGIATYQDLYSLGAYADSRVKAVDALTGSSAPSEFSIQSEDFPALGGASASASLRAVNASSAIANGAYQIDTSSMRSSLQKVPVSDSFYDRKLSSVSSQPQSVLARVNMRQDATTNRMAQRNARLPNGYTTNDALSSLQLHHAPSSHVSSQHAFRDLSSTSPRRAGPQGASNGPQLFQMRARQADLDRRMDDYETLDSREAASRHKVSTQQNSKPIAAQESRFSRSRMPNGQSNNNTDSHAMPPSSRPSVVNDASTNAVSTFRSDKFGMLSLLPLVSSGGQVSRKDRVLPIGIDLTALGLNLNSHEPLYKTFHNPWEGGQGRAGDNEFVGSSQKGQETEYRLPTCYYMQAPALRTNHFTKFQLETLFYIFYMMPQDVLQLLAAVELYNRKWRYHKTLKLWFTCDVDPSSGYEGGYSYFDIKSWGKREFHEVNDNQSFIKGFMTEDELASVKIPPLPPL
eukprot:TRINITY_DN213_c0_g2_i10.p1 TRINITY_DN213_c0_g2~~TRINITY_DN213_c0_g2_i10.p1  ORF type:complete len:632 (-),score=104.87 TRINITY_DN213_c0_g2_i10:19-1914(-)